MLHLSDQKIYVDLVCDLCNKQWSLYLKFQNFQNDSQWIISKYFQDSYNSQCYEQVLKRLHKEYKIIAKEETLSTKTETTYFMRFICKMRTIYINQYINGGS